MEFFIFLSMKLQPLGIRMRHPKKKINNIVLQGGEGWRLSAMALLILFDIQSKCALIINMLTLNINFPKKFKHS